MWQDSLESETRDGFGFVLKGNVNDLGYQAVTTPGSLMAYGQAIEEFGSLDWADVCAPAIKTLKKDSRSALTCIHGGTQVPRWAEWTSLID